MERRAVCRGWGSGSACARCCCWRSVSSATWCSQYSGFPSLNRKSRVADSIVGGQAIDEARILSWLQQLYPPDTFKRYGQIQISANIDGAQVYVNSKASGSTPLGDALHVLAPGNYRILVEKAKYLPFQAAVTVMPDTTVEVSATLMKEQKQTPWYKRWYVWTGIVAGVGAVAATAVAVKLGTEVPPPDTSQLPGTVVFK